MDPYQQHPAYPAGYGHYPASHAPHPSQQPPQYRDSTQLPPMAFHPQHDSHSHAGMTHKNDSTAGLTGPVGAMPYGMGYAPGPDAYAQGYPQHYPQTFQQSFPHQVPMPPLEPPQAAQQAQPGASNGAGNRPMSYSTTVNGRIYALEIGQQPQRARMCGFGDKDRRPITPPPCVRLVVTDAETGKEIKPDDQSECSFFVLQVELWSEHADREANVVKASASTPSSSISSSTTTSYPPPPERVPSTVYLTHGQANAMYAAVSAGSMAGYGPGFPMVAVPNLGWAASGPGMAPVTANNAMYTRNLIGSLTVNASRLQDLAQEWGYWFVLQDLSVRTEGNFRLKMSFTDISNHDGSGVNKGKAPIAAWTFSDPFQVYSAKKFPGVIESTPLSKAFATQGIKIPIRKDNKNEVEEEE